MPRCEVPVFGGNQHSSVPVAGPQRDRLDIHPTHDATADEEVLSVVESDVANFRQLLRMG
jgi:hypothetical protein